MIRNETAQNGVIIYADIIDITTSTVSREENGVIVSTRPFTAEEIERYGPQPLAIEGPYGDESLSSAAAGEVLTYDGGQWLNNPVPEQIVVASADAGAAGYNGGFIPGASFVGQISNTGHGINGNYLYWNWITVVKELTITALFIKVGTVGVSGDLLRIGLFSFDLADLPTASSSGYYFTLYEDFGTLPLDVAGQQTIDLSSSPFVVPPGLYGLGTASNYNSSGTMPRCDGVAIAHKYDVPMSYTSASAGIRSYSNPRHTGNQVSNVNNGFPATPLIAQNGWAAAASTIADAGAIVFFKGYTTQ